jgi:CubicO group peptidase (beta-lactamase class C family)
MRQTLITTAFLLALVHPAPSQPLYFPPLTGTTWETVTPASLGWCTQRIDTLYNFLAANRTRAFIVLKDGRIALEQYFGSFTRDSIWYWASAGKTLTAFLVGIAQREGLLSITDSTSRYLGTGWTSCPPNKERLITVLNQLTMTSGLRDFVADPYCTLPSCLIYQADAGTRWAYHNAPYTLLDQVVESATGQTYNQYFAAKIRSRIGMNGLWLRQGYNNVYFSNARSAARFGLLALNNGIWNTDTLMRDTSYFRRMVNTSQNLNLSYGYLWWLNGKASYMLPGTQFVFPGSLAPNAPRDMIAAMGKNGQFINVVPSQRLVVVRMGEAPDSTFEVPTEFNNDIWRRLNEVICNQTSVEENPTPVEFALEQNYPNPFNPTTRIRFGIPVSGFVSLKVFDVLGREVATLVNEPKAAGEYEVVFDATNQPAGGHGITSGVYFYRLTAGGFTSTRRLLLLK